METVSLLKKTFKHNFRTTCTGFFTGVVALRAKQSV